MKVNAKRIEKDIEEINKFNSTPGQGISRATFTQEYMGAIGYIFKELEKIGAEIKIMRGGNIRARLEGTVKDAPSVMIGSHIDSVFQGGKFDGVVGTVTSLEVIRTISENKVFHKNPIDFVIFVEEDGSRFSSVLLGSRIWTGKVKEEEISKIIDKEGISYREAMTESGLIPEDNSILEGRKIKAMIEPHIEQSLVLESQGLSIGIVETIAGIKQLEVTIEGVSNHAGATPMNLRNDALCGVAEIILNAEMIASQNRTSVATVGLVEVTPGKTNIIPGKVRFTLDIRDKDDVTLNEISDKILKSIEVSCKNRGLSDTIKLASYTKPVLLSKKIVEIIENSAKNQGIDTLRMISGAVHDSSVIAELTDVGMIFVPSRGGRSHCPEEYTPLKDIEIAANILLESVIELSK
ncbi:MAG: allantoate amidohydrolase [Candidatus Methanofastidiosum methylothiophilum]|uniref:Allantoate amidohydrolase n=1 Tax=Candidatus Methanofastidiosum methylothiophilum TaxID=1705564 RepID=A0A150IRY4_9EURY|nr:MAG: allantoate amidohydrolase [Candidatus Methanofastidiosum methylthiophilus]KYC47753.1 MAG: allantoate amidohydrolase [Candidatus Methanofastidiosum methylthiophilus]KYC50524.1 MAG: allantoate amidohydrolase [Candidatus Methanofastidiosum methylthiophilus]